MNAHSRKIARNAAVVGGATLLSRILGFIRDVVVAFALGAGLGADAFFVAFRVPNLLRRLFGEGSLSMAFIPVFSRIRKEDGEAEAFTFARSVQVWLLAILAVIVLLGVAFARPLTMAIAPGFLDNPEQFELTVSLVRICFPYILLISSVALYMGILNSLDHFLAPALAPCLLNVVLIAAALIGYFSGVSVPVALSWGVIAGGMAQWLMQQPYLRRNGFTWTGGWSWRHKGVSRVGKLMLPTVFGAAVYQVNILLSTLLASFLPTGSVSYLYYADRLVQFPLGVFGVAVSTAALPSLAKLAAEQNMKDFRGALGSSMGLTLFISLPAAAGLIALADPIIRLLFHRGAFSMEAVAATSAALVAYGVGLPAIALVRPLVSAFYALEDTKTPVKIAFICMFVNIGLGFALMQYIAHVGLALAVSVSGWVNLGLLSFALRGRIKRLPGIRRTVFMSGTLSLLMGAGAYLTLPLGWLWALALIPLWGVLYLGGAWLLKAPEAVLLTSALGRRLRRSA